MTNPLPGRASGVLLHPSSLPGPLGAGDFGDAAFRFVDWLADAGLGLWQILPLAPAGNGDSPYMSPSAFAIDPVFIDLQALRDQGLLAPDALDHERLPAAFGQAQRQAAFAANREFRMARLREAALRWFELREPGGYESFCVAEAHWLDDYARFMTIAQAYPGRSWQDWPAGLRDRDPAALATIDGGCDEDIGFWKFCQWIASRQWSALHAHARHRGVRVIGDAPIFVAGHSADVWAHRRLFALEADGSFARVAGVPPDYFSATGQRWGNPVYDWEANRAEGYRWWIARLRRQAALADIVRLDHFRGFAAGWEIPAQAPDATTGQWRPGPGAMFFEAVRKALGGLPLVAEDLGTITPDVVALREQFGLPGMRVLQFAFAEGPGQPYLPHNLTHDSVVYTGTHDNDTSRGWFGQAAPHEQRMAQIYLKTDGREIHWDLIHAASQSVARYAIWPLQDVLGAGSDERMNRPGSAEGNWGWRFGFDRIEPWHTRRLREISAVHGRNGATLPDG
ncbi:MAG: 4-alpha-glucanotransferase [Pseudomonadota bacterium]|nr:4-alpha-glucanotransferase [Pseudomonadota bacterium]